MNTLINFFVYIAVNDSKFHFFFPVQLMLKIGKKKDMLGGFLVISRNQLIISKPLPSC